MSMSEADPIFLTGISDDVDKRSIDELYFASKECFYRLSVYVVIVTSSQIKYLKRKYRVRRNSGMTIQVESDFV